MEERSLLSQNGYVIIDPIAFTIAVKRAGGVQNLFNNLNDLEQKAIQETEKKEISIEDFQSFSSSVSSYLSIFENTLLAKEKEFTSPDTKEIKEIDLAIKNIRDTFAEMDSYRIAEEEFKKQKDSFGEIKRKIIEWKNSPINNDNIVKRNQMIEELAESYGPALDNYKKAENEYSAKKGELKKYIKNINIQDLKNDLFKQLIIIEDNFRKLKLFEVLGLSDALSNLKGGIEMEIGMFGINLEGDKDLRVFEDTCRRFGVKKESVHNLDMAETKEDSISKSIESQQNDDNFIQSVKEENDIRQSILETSGLLSGSNSEEKEPELNTNNEVFTPFEFPYVDNNFSSENKETDSIAEEEAQQDDSLGFLQAPTIEEPVLNDDLFTPHSNEPLLFEENEELTPINSEQKAENDIVDNIVSNIPFEQDESPIIDEASYQANEPVVEDNIEVKPFERKEEEKKESGLKKKINGIRKSVSNKCLKAIMLSSAITGITLKHSENSTTIGEAIINSDIAKGVKKLGDKMKLFGELNVDLFVDDETLSPKDRIGNMFNSIKGKYLSAYSSIRMKLKEKMAKNAAQDNNAQDNTEFANSINNQLDNEGVAR